MGLFLTVLFFKWSPRTGYQRNNFRLKMKVSQFVDEGSFTNCVGNILALLDHLLSTYPRPCLHWGGNSFIVICKWKTVVSLTFLTYLPRLVNVLCERPQSCSRDLVDCVCAILRGPWLDEENEA
jgi:hypothetical protein